MVGAVVDVRRGDGLVAEHSTPSADRAVMVGARACPSPDETVKEWARTLVLERQAADRGVGAKTIGGSMSEWRR